MEVIMILFGSHELKCDFARLHDGLREFTEKVQVIEIFCYEMFDKMVPYLPNTFLSENGPKH